MSPLQFKRIRKSFGLTQKELADCFGLTQKAVSHYETGFRKPGKTVRVIMTLLYKLPLVKAKELLNMMGGIAKDFTRNKPKQRLQ